MAATSAAAAAAAAATYLHFHLLSLAPPPRRPRRRSFTHPATAAGVLPRSLRHSGLAISSSPTRFSCAARSSGAERPEDDPPDLKEEARVSDGEEEVHDLGVKVALSMLKFYKREISPLMLSSCRYVPTCSEYSMQAYKKYGVMKGTILTACRLCRCNPLGGSGFDPPRWFEEEEPYEQE